MILFASRGCYMCGRRQQFVVWVGEPGADRPSPFSIWSCIMHVHTCQLKIARHKN